MPDISQPPVADGSRARRTHSADAALAAGKTPAIDRRRFLAASVATIAAAPVLAAAPASASPRLRAGAATSNITPPLGSSTSGVIARSGPAVQVHDELSARCLALDDGRTRVAFAVCDARMIARGIIDRAKSLVKESTGLPPECVFVSATHTHGAPGLLGNASDELDRWYEDFIARRIADGIRRALGNLAPAEAGWGGRACPKHVFNRRWRMKPGAIPPNPFGLSTDRVQMNPPAGSPNLLEPAGPVDPELAVLSIRRTDGRPLALLGNYGLHYVGGYVSGHISADYYSLFAGRIEQRLGVDDPEPPFVAMMSNGTSGDVNNIDPRQPRAKEAPWTRMREVAFDLAEEALASYGKIEHRRDVSLAVAATELSLGVRKPDGERIAWAKKVVDAVKNPSRLSRPEIYAGEALELAKFPDRVSLAMQAVRIGDLGISAIPCEVFAETGVAIKAQSPVKRTFVMELANGYNGYLPTAAQHELGGYETWPARSAYLEPQAEAKIRQTALDLLGQVAAKSG